MFEEFAKKKFIDYESFLEFNEERITFQKIRNSNLPPYIINFLDCSYNTGLAFISKNDFDEILNRAIVFNINYVIKPKSTLLKFLFGDMETRPADHIKEKLRYFQFYSYYIETINEFINVNTPFVISIEQIEHIISEVNKKIYTEITDPSGESQRLNLIKLLYYFFLDLTINNPINIKLPKKILSLFFGDKDFTDIKNRIDKFFSDEIFIQEAVELMKPPLRKAVKTKLPNIPERKTEQSTTIADKQLIDQDTSEKDIERTITQPIEEDKITEFRPATEEDIIKRMVENKKIMEEDMRTGETINGVREDNVSERIVPEEQKQYFILSELFSEESFRKKIIKKLFRKDEKLFNETVLRLLGVSDWDNAITVIEEYFDSNKINYLTDEAVKFVDVIQNYFATPDESTLNKQENANH